MAATTFDCIQDLRSACSGFFDKVHLSTLSMSVRIPNKRALLLNRTATNGVRNFEQIAQVVSFALRERESECFSVSYHECCNSVYASGIGFAQGNKLVNDVACWLDPFGVSPEAAW